MVPLGRRRKSGYKYASIRSPTLSRRGSDISSVSSTPASSTTTTTTSTSSSLSPPPTSPSCGSSSCSNRAVVISALSFAAISTTTEDELGGLRSLPPHTPRVTRPRNGSCPPTFDLTSSSGAVPVRSHPSPTRGGLDKLVGQLATSISLVSRDRSQSVGSASSASREQQHTQHVSRRSNRSAIVLRSKEIVVRRLSDDMDLLSLSSSGESSEDDASTMMMPVNQSAKWFTRSVASRDLIRVSPSSSVISPASSASAAQAKQKRRSVLMSGPIFNSCSALPTTMAATSGRRMAATASWSLPSSPSASASSSPVRTTPTSHSAPPFRNVRVIESIPANTSLAYQTVFGELAIKCELKSGEMAAVPVASPADRSAEESTLVAGAGVIRMETVDVSLVRIDEQRPDFGEVERQLESIYNFSKRGVEPELWYTDADGDTLRLHDSLGLQYAVEDWRFHLLPLRRQRNAGASCPTTNAVTPPPPSMRLLINERRRQ